MKEQTILVCGTILLLPEQKHDQILNIYEKRLHFLNYHCHSDLIFYVFFTLERVGSLSAASTVVPPLAACGGLSPATGRLLGAADPSRFHYRNLLQPRCGARDNAVHSPPNGGALALSGQVSLGL